VPSLDRLAAEPTLTAQLPRQALLEARRAAQRLLADLDMAVAMLTPVPAPREPVDGQDPDRLLTKAEAAQFLGRSLQWMRHHGRHLPGRVALNPRAIGYQRSALERLLKQRAQQ
jgi:hypothetical protein